MSELYRLYVFILPKAQSLKYSHSFCVINWMNEWRKKKYLILFLVLMKIHRLRHFAISGVGVSSYVYNILWFSFYRFCLKFSSVFSHRKYAWYYLKSCRVGSKLQKDTMQAAFFLFAHFLFKSSLFYFFIFFCHYF